MADKFIYISNDDTQNYLFCRLQLVVKTFGLNKPTKQNSIKVPKVFKPTNKKTLLLNFVSNRNYEICRGKHGAKLILQCKQMELGDEERNEESDFDKNIFSYSVESGG